MCIFPEPTVTDISYLHMLENSYQSYSKIWIQNSFINKMGHPSTSIAKLLPNLSRTVVTWIGRGGTIARAPRSPDLIP